MSFMSADVFEVLPATAALLMRRLLDHRSEGVTASDVQFAKDEELVQSRSIVPDGVREAFVRQGQTHGRFQR